MNSSNKNPGTEAFDRVQRWAILPIILIAAVLAIWRNDVSWAVLPIAIVIGALYLLFVIWGSRLIRRWGSRVFDRDH